MPLVDVAAAGGWKDPNTLLRSYARPDDATLLAVVTNPQKITEVLEQ